jgi:hypothetical protein
MSEEERMWKRSVFFLVGSNLADDRDDAADRDAPAEVRLGPLRRRRRCTRPRHRW